MSSPTDEQNRRAPSLPGTWGAMSAGQKNDWLQLVGCDGVNWKARTRRFHAWTTAPGIGVSITASGRTSLDEAISVRDRLRAMVKREGLS